MRKLFSSPRIENVERLEAVLQQAQIATRVTSRRSFITGRPHFDYSERGSEASWPALWVVRADDYSRARQVLRDAGLLEARAETAYFSESEPGAAPVPASRRAASRVRLALIATVLVLAALSLWRMLRG